MERRLAIAAIVLALALVPLVSAAVVNPNNLDVQTPERRDMSTILPQTVDAQAGNITGVNIEALTVTTSWQGYYGNVSGSIVLDDANNNTFYNWSMSTAQGEVYASRASSPTWASIGCAGAGSITAEETYLGQLPTDGDSVTNTFSATSHPQFNVSTVFITANSCPSTNAFINTGSSATDFYQILLSDGSNIVYTTILDDNQVSFNGGTADFELLVSENGKADTTATPYYFFVELA